MHFDIFYPCWLWPTEIDIMTLWGVVIHSLSSTEQKKNGPTLCLIEDKWGVRKDIWTWSLRVRAGSTLNKHNQKVGGGWREESMLTSKGIIQEGMVGADG